MNLEDQTLNFIHRKTLKSQALFCRQDTFNPLLLQHPVEINMNLYPKFKPLSTVGLLSDNVVQVVTSASSLGKSQTIRNVSWKTSKLNTLI